MDKHLRIHSRVLLTMHRHLVAMSKLKEEVDDLLIREGLIVQKESLTSAIHSDSR